MEDMLYPISLILIVLMAFTFFRSGNTKLMLLMLAIGVYIVYSHETGYTATDFKNEMVDSIGKSAEEFSKENISKEHPDKK